MPLKVQAATKSHSQSLLQKNSCAEVKPERVQDPFQCMRMPEKLRKINENRINCRWENFGSMMLMCFDEEEE